MKQIPQKKRGFTLIELLIVIAIVGILSSIGLVALNGAREKARDAQRISDLSQYRTGLVLYFDNNDTSYPPVLGSDLHALCGSAISGDSNYVYAYASDLWALTDTDCDTCLFDEDNPEIIGSYLASRVSPPTLPLVTTSPEFADLYCYDVNGGVSAADRTGFVLYTKLESGTKEWYYLLSSGQSGTDPNPHTYTNCVIASLGCTW